MKGIQGLRKLLSITLTVLMLLSCFEPFAGVYSGAAYAEADISGKEVSEQTDTYSDPAFALNAGKYGGSQAFPQTAESSSPQVSDQSQDSSSEEPAQSGSADEGKAGSDSGKEKEKDKGRSEENPDPAQTAEDEPSANIEGNAADSAGSGGKAERSADDGTQAEADKEAQLKYRDVDVVISEDAYTELQQEGEFTGTELPTPAFSYMSRFWMSLAGEETALPTKEEIADRAHRDVPVKVAVKALVPEGVKAEVNYIEPSNEAEDNDRSDSAAASTDDAAVNKTVTDDQKAASTEKELFGLEIKLVDKDGNVYVPAKDEPVEVTIKGGLLKDELKAKNPAVVYAYAENEERNEEYTRKYKKELEQEGGDEFYSANVLVYESEGFDRARSMFEPYDKDKEYKNGDDAVRYVEDENGLSTRDDAVTFTYDYSVLAKASASKKNPDEESTIKLVAASQQPESTEPEQAEQKAEQEQQKAEGQEAAKSESDSKDDVSEDKKDENAESIVAVKGKVLTAGDGRTYEVTVSYGKSAGIPEDAELQVTDVSKDLGEYSAYLSETAKKLDKDADSFDFVHALDIKLLDPKTGEEYHPEKNVKVSVKLLNKDSSIEDASVLHFEDQVSGDADSNSASSLLGDSEMRSEILGSTVKGDTVKFETDGFSVYVIAGYTVDFHLGDYTYSIAGESEIKLSELFEKLGITEIGIDDVEEVSFSNEELVKVEKVENDWLLTSLRPFDTEEILTLKLKNGEVFKIKVTDESEIIGSWPCNSTASDNVTCTLYSNGDMIISGTGSMKNYTNNPWVKDTPWYKAGVMDQIKKIVVTDGITHLGTNTFTRAGALAEIDASACTTLIDAGSDLFKVDSGKSHLEKVDFSGNANFTGFGANAFQNVNTIQYIDISNTQLTGDILSNTTAGFGASKTAITTLKANNCSELTIIDLSGHTSLTTLELSGCTNLTGMNLPVNLTTLDVSGCTGIDSLDLSSCTSLTTVKVGNRDDQTDLSWLTLPASVTTLDASGFTSLTSIEVPSSVTSLNVSDCTGLTTLNLSNCTNLTTLDASGCTDLTSLTLPNSITTLNLSGCTSLDRDSLNIPSSARTLNVSGCTGLTALNLSGTSLTDINVSNNANLTALKLPASISTLNVNGCQNLVIYYDGKAENLPGLPDYVSVISWGDYSYTIERNSTVSINEIFSSCGITAIDSSDVSSISVSDDTVLEVDENLSVKYLKSFENPQTLTINLKNGIFGNIEVKCASLEESDQLNGFLDDNTVYSFENETDVIPISEPAILKQGDCLKLSLSFSEIPEDEAGERQMKLSGPMKFTFPARIEIYENSLPESVTISISSGDDAYTFNASVERTVDDTTSEESLIITVDPGEHQNVISDADNVSFSVPVTVRPVDVPGDYTLNDSLTLSVVESHNVKVSSISAGDYDSESDTIPYTVIVEAESDLDFEGKEYSVTISDLTNVKSGTFTYTHKAGFELPDGKPESQVNGEDVSSEATEFTQFPLTVAHMYAGDKITLYYSAKPLQGDYSDSNQVNARNTITITNKDADNKPNPSNDPKDDTASVTTTIPYTPLVREHMGLDGSWAYWKVTVNPNGYTLGGGKALTLADTFDDDVPADADQSIDYASVKVTSEGNVTYDYSGKTGTFVIPDKTPVTITYRTRITAPPGGKVLFRGTAALKNSDKETIATSTAGITEEEVVVYPSASDVGGLGTNFMVKMYVYPDKNMQQGIEGAQFILLDANQRPLEYKVGENKGKPVTFTTGSDGYVNIELNEEPGDISIEKNTGYYLEMMQAVEGYQKDNTLYSFMITDDPSYSSGDFYKYYNGDTMKVRLYPKTSGLSVSLRFSGSYPLTEDQQNNVTAVLQKMVGEDDWVEVERHPYTDSQWGAITFEETLYDPSLGGYQNIYRVVEENQKPWDLPADIVVDTTYYSMVNTDPAVPNQKKPQEFSVSSADDSVSVVIDNRYEEPQLTLIKMDKQTGKTLPGARFSVYEIVNGQATGDSKREYTTVDDGEVVIRGGEPYESETLYGIKETAAPTGYLLPIEPEWHYFYFCNDEYLEPSILANLPEDTTAVNLTKSGDIITVDNQKELITIPVMKIWQGSDWPEGKDVLIGLYQSVEGSGVEEKVLDDDGEPKTVTLSKDIPYNNTRFTNLPSRNNEGKNIIYSIKEEKIIDDEGEKDPLEAGYNQEYGVSSAGVYIVRNKPATSLTVSKKWYDRDDNEVTDEDTLLAQSPVTFDVYRSTRPLKDTDPEESITNAEMTDFVSHLELVREKEKFGNDDNWSKTIEDLDLQDDLRNHYYYYVLEYIPSFGTEIYDVNKAEKTVAIKNRIAPDPVKLTVTKAPLEKDPRPESLDTDFEFTLKLQKDDAHPIRSWQVYTDTENPENNLVTDGDGKVTFKLKPTDPDQQPTPGASITLSLPQGVTAAVTEKENSEYTVETASNVSGTTDDNGRTFLYETGSNDAELTYTNTLHVICKVVQNDRTQIPFESLKSALNYIRNNTDKFTAPWTIELLEDYTIPVTDVVEVGSDERLTITTASTGDDLFPFKGGEETDRAVITRGGDGGSMLKNQGTLTLENICLDGNIGNYTANEDGGLVNSTGTLNLNNKATLRNSVSSSKCGAIYAEGTVNIVDGVEVTGNSAPSASALYLKGTLNMTGGSITDNTGAADGAVVVEDTTDVINLSGHPTIINNTNQQGKKAANLYIGVDSDNVVNVISPGIDSTAKIGVSAMEGHMLIGEQFASAEYEQTAHLNGFVNDTYGYRGKLKDGTSTNIVWDGLTIEINKMVDPPIGANPNDRFTITLASSSIIMSNYIIDGTLDYTVEAARQGRLGRIILRNVKAADKITISPLPVGTYKITEDAPNYSQTYTIVETEDGGTDPVPIGDDGSFDADSDCTVTVTNARKLADVKLTKALEDGLERGTVDFGFTIQLTEADGTPVSNFPLKTDEEPGFVTDANGNVSFTMSPTDASDALQSFRAPVGATMTITETVNPNYSITTSAVTMPEEGEGETITDLDEDHDNIFKFSVTEDGADVKFNNNRKSAEIELSKTLNGKVSKEESFDYTLILKNGDDPVSNYNIMYKDEEHQEKSIITDRDGKAVITFTFGQDDTDPKSILLTIPDGMNLEVSETKVTKDVGGTEQPIYNTSYSINGGTATTGLKASISSVSDNDHSIAFTNTRKTNTITVTNTVSGYSGNVVPFTYTATVTDGGEDQDDYDENGFTDGVMRFDLTTGQSKVLTVPYGATLKIAEAFIVGYETTVKHGSGSTFTRLYDEFQVSQDITVAFTNKQLIGLRLVNNTSSELRNVTITVQKNKIYLVNDDQTDQELISDNKTATISIGTGKTAILEIEHDASATAAQDYTVSGLTPEDEYYYYTINNEPSFHEYANPAVLHIYKDENFVLKGKLRYSVNDSIITFTEQPLVSFDSNGGVWTTDMEGYNDRDGDRTVYQKAVTKGEKVARPRPDPVYPTAEGITFLGWTRDEVFAKQSHTAGEDISAKAYDFDNTEVDDPITLYAVWAKPVRDNRVVTVSNERTDELYIIASLTQNGTEVANYDVTDNLTTGDNGEVSFTLGAGAKINLELPDAAKLELSLDKEALAVSSVFELTNSPDRTIFTVDSVKRDGTITFIPGVCKITDAAGNVLYDLNGKPAVYGTLSEAFTKYKTTLYTDEFQTTQATPAAIKMLVDEYEIDSSIMIPDYSDSKNKDITLTTAGKDDHQFPFVGLQERTTLYRGSSFTRDSLFKITNAANLTLTDIIIDGKNVKVGEFNGNLIYFNKDKYKLTINSGTIMRNADYASYTNNCGGGAIYMSAGALNVNAGQFYNLHANQGGAICVTGGTLNIEGKNNAQNTDETVKTENASIQFEDCYSEKRDGGAIYYNRGADVLINGGTDRMKPGIAFKRCVAAYTDGQNDGSDGGAIFATSNYTNTVTVKGCTFIECSARTGNKQSTSGFGGGAICGLKVKGLTVEACTFESCDSLCGGGAIATYVKTKTKPEENPTVNIINSVFNQCNCKSQGGALAIYQDEDKNANSETKLAINNSHFNGCSSGTNNGSGGAIQCYLPCMSFENSHFTDCWAGKEGGAVNNFFANKYGDMWSKSYLTLTGCSFTRCRAEDRYQAEQMQHYGGAVNTKVKTVTVTNSEFTDCVSTLREGGALHLGGIGTGSAANITGSTFKNCMAKTGGGAVMASAETLTVSNSYFYGCQAFGRPAANYNYDNANKKNQNGGGAVSHSENSRNTSTQNTTKIINCVFSTDPDSTEAAQSCSTATNGGAVWTRAKNVTISGCEIDGCTAGENGGGLYLANQLSSSTTTIENIKVDDTVKGSITNCKAVMGSAVFVEDKAIFSGFIIDPDNPKTLGDLNISGNAVSEVNDGAIHGGKLYFEGNVRVENNTCSSDSTYNHDVLMQNDNVETIYTTNVGLGVGANIGVYVPDQYFSKRGIEDTPFGTYAADEGSNNLESFFNDRDSELYGYQKSENDSKIYWGIFVCKITDASGNILKRENGRDAVYPKLTQALDEFKKVKDSAGQPIEAKYIKMLVENYAIRQNEAITNFPDGADITLTTALRSDNEHPYRGTAGTVCTISRTTGNNALFDLSKEGVTFQLQDITLDGRNNKSSSQGDYKLITVSSGSLKINSGTTLQYGKGDNGAAITGGESAQIEIYGSYDTEKNEPKVVITNCTATGNGGAINAKNLTINNTINTFGEYGTVFKNCSSGAGGGAIYVSGSPSITGAAFTDCHSNGEGGALFHYNATASATINNCKFSNSYSENSAGGAISSNASGMTVGSSIFDACYAKTNGGAINHTGTNNITINNCDFNSCRNTTTVSNTGLGGSVYTSAETVSVEHSTFENSNAHTFGGALYCENSEGTSVATIKGTTFENCSTSSTIGTVGKGGAIYSKNKTLNVQSYTAEGATTGIQTNINSCMVLGAEGMSGAIHMETSGSTLNIMDGTVISGCYADKGGAIYLQARVTMNLKDGSQKFEQNGYTTLNGSIVDATEGACIYLAENSRINLSGKLRFSRNILPNKDRITNGGTTDYMRQDIYMAGYASDTPFHTNAASIYVVGELTGDTIWVWPEKDPHRKPNEQFAKIADNVTVSEDSLGHLRNSLADSVTDCSYGEYLAGVQISTDTENIYWDKMYTISFKKVDNKGVTVPNAVFTLYKDSACTQSVATAVSADGETDTDTQGKLLKRGTVEFTAIRIGAYYMKETTVPVSFKENTATYLVLVGTPYLSPNDNNRYLWEGDGPLNVTDAATLVARHTTDAGKYYGIFPLDENNKAILRANLASNSVGIENIRNDYQAWFMKLDESNDSLPGAAFTIYKAILDEDGQPETFDDGYPMLMRWTRDGETYPAPVESADGTDKYKDIHNITLPKGLVYFRELPLGTYYLLETSYPERNGKNRRTFYQESDRVLKLIINLNEDTQELTRTVDELVLEGDGKYHSHALPQDDKYYNLSNSEVVCKLTDADNYLLYSKGHDVWDNTSAQEATTKYYPAIYPTLEEGFNAAQGYAADGKTSLPLYDKTETLVGQSEALKLQAMKDLTLSERIDYNSLRPLTFTTAATRAEKDKYIFITNRTSDTSRAQIKNEKTDNGTLITISGPDGSENGAEMTLQNILLDGQKKDNRTGRAVHVKGNGKLTILNDTKIQNFRVVVDDSDTDYAASGGAVLMNKGTTLSIDGGYNRTAEFSGNEVVNKRQDDNSKQNAKGGALALSSECSVTDFKNVRFNGNKVSSEKGTANGGAVSICVGDELTLENAVFDSNVAKDKGGAIYVSNSESEVSLTLTNNLIQNNRSKFGSAVYIGNNRELTVSSNQSDAKITNNTASENDGGAINAGSGAKYYFVGAPYIYDNKNGEQQKNVVLSEDSNDVINTTTDGLGSKAKIGVYVTDEKNTEGKTLYELHGDQDMPFGKFGKDTDPKPDEKANLHLESFKNDRNPYFGIRKEDEEDTEGYIIYWSRPDGFRKVIFRKVNTGYDPIKGAKFDIVNSSEIPVQVEVAEGKIKEELKDRTTEENGIIWVGTLPYGTYYLHEKQPNNKWFCAIVNGTGVYISSEKDTKNEAKEDAEAKLPKA